MRKRAPRLPAAQIKKVIALKAAGLTVPEIAQKLGLPESRIKHAYQKAPPRGQTLGPAKPPKGPSPPRPEGPPRARFICGASVPLLTAALMEGLSLAEPHAQTLAILISRQGDSMTFRELRAAHGVHRPLNQQALYERISQLRQVLGREALGPFIQPVYRCQRGTMDTVEYYVTEAAYQKCVEALRRASERLVLRRPPAPPELPGTLSLREEIEAMFAAG